MTASRRDLARALRKQRKRVDRALQNAMMGVDSYAVYQQAREVYRKREMALYDYDWDTGFVHILTELRE